MKKILVVDDDVDILNVVELMLTHHDFIVKTTSKWQIIPQTIKAFNPDLILLDIDLDGADGSDICKKIKQSKKTQQLPVILFSVHYMPEEYVKACNAQGFLAKPFETSNLVELIRHNLN
ncbi:MAG: response regulator [Chitinophagaceae bacterium]|jgi:DNA-binding response OmpR family regulator|nr:response regulator [Chitinophagaceae bacterium]